MLTPGGAICRTTSPVAAPALAVEPAVAGPTPGAAAPYVPLPGVEELWAETRGDRRVTVALLDGPVDLNNPALRGADLVPLDSLVSAGPERGGATRHGTSIASAIFGRQDGPSPGIAPGCRGVFVPIFESTEDGGIRPCSQLDLARALTAALLSGAHVINVSGGQFSPGGAAHPLLSRVVEDCAKCGVLIVAAAGNEGCECLHVPAALDPVLAVGAMDARGEPLGFSNWGPAYRTRGVLAPGEGFPGAAAGGPTQVLGTSYATAIVSGVAALLLSLQLRRGERPDPYAVRDAILAGARDFVSNRVRAPDARYLAGPLNVRGAVYFLTQGRPTMSEPNEVQASDLAVSRVSAPARPAEPAAAPRAQEKPAEAKPEGCSCGAKKPAGPTLAYALGQLGYDFPNEARLDSLAQKMAGEAGVRVPERAIVYDQRRFLSHLEGNAWDAAAVEWTLSVDGTTLYAVRPMGPFAPEGYQMLRRFLKEQLDEGVERISVPGYQSGKATLLNGQTVPAIVPDLRGMYSWTTNALVDAVAGKPARNAPAAERNGNEQRREGVRNFLARLYHELRNLGLSPQDRALNYAATNAFAVGQIYAAAIQEKMDFDHVNVAPSPIGRPGSDCWDVELYFFYPERQVQTVRKVYRFTVDVSDVVPVTVGTVRSWFTR